jgi:VWFA-related protein
VKSLFLLLIVAAPLAAQQRPPALSETIEVSIVNLDVVVTDRKGNRVRGLRPSDFEVREDGKVRTLSNFAEYDAPMETPGQVKPPEEPAAAAVPGDRRVMVIFVERARLMPYDADRIYKTLEEAVERVIRPGDAASVVFWDRSLEVKQDFTDNVPALKRAIAEIREISKHLTLPDARSIEERQEEQDRLDALLVGGDVSSPDLMANESTMLARRALMLIRSKVYALRSLIGLMAPVEGKKILFMATRRLSDFAGAEFFPSGSMPADRRHEFDTRDLLKSLENAANAANVTIYGVYPVGMPKTASVSAERVSAPDPIASGAFEWNVLLNESQPLDALARATGGLSAWGGGSISEMIPAVVEDMHTYYSMAFSAGPEKKKERKITVRALNPDYRVRARRSFVEKTEPERMADRVVAHLFWPVAPNQLGVTAEIGDGTKQRRTTLLPVKIRVPIARLTLLPQPGEYAGGFTVFAAAGGKKVGVVSDVFQKTQSVRIPTADIRKARGSHYTYSFTVKTDGRAEYVSLGVLDDVSQQFSVVKLPLVAPGQ